MAEPRGLSGTGCPGLELRSPTVLQCVTFLSWGLSVPLGSVLNMGLSVAKWVVLSQEICEL